jgi:hypothetical protein
MPLVLFVATFLKWSPSMTLSTITAAVLSPFASHVTGLAKAMPWNWEVPPRR